MNRKSGESAEEEVIRMGIGESDRETGRRLTKRHRSWFQGQG